MEEQITCTHCGAVIEGDDYTVMHGGSVVCSDCIANYCCTCERCGATIFETDAYGDEFTNLCQDCYETHYTRCEGCDRLLHNDDGLLIKGLKQNLSKRKAFKFCLKMQMKR